VNEIIYLRKWTYCINETEVKEWTLSHLHHRLFAPAIVEKQAISMQKDAMKSMKY